MQEPRHAAPQQRPQRTGADGTAPVVRLDDIIGWGGDGRTFGCHRAILVPTRRALRASRALRNASGNRPGTGLPALLPGERRGAVGSRNHARESLPCPLVAPAAGAVARPAGLLRTLDHRGADGIEVDVSRHGHQRAEGALEKDALETAFPDRAGVLVAPVVVLRIGLLERLAELGEIIHPGAHSGLLVVNPPILLLLRPFLPFFKDCGIFAGPVPGEHPPLQLLVRNLLLPRHAHQQMEMVAHDRERIELHPRERRRPADHLQQDRLLRLVDEKTLSSDPAHHVVEPFSVHLDPWPPHSALLSSILSYLLCTSRNLAHLFCHYKNFLRGQTPLI